MVRARTWERRLVAAKAKHRPKLKDWSKDTFGVLGSVALFDEFHKKEE